MTSVESPNEEIERLQCEMARQHGYEILDHNLVLYVKPLKDSGEGS